MGKKPMGTITSESFLEQLITIQRRAIRYYILFALGLAVFGVVIIVAGILSPASWFTPIFPNAQEGVKGAFGWGGGFITSLIGLPIKEIVNRNGNIRIFETIRGQLGNLKKAPKSERDRVQKQLEDLMWKYVEKAALG
jgi:hypothetical protein